MSTKAIWILCNMNDCDEEISDFSEKLGYLIGMYVDDDKLLEEAGLTSVKEVLYDTTINDHVDLVKKLRELTIDQWEIGWKLVNDTISEAGGLYRKYSGDPDGTASSDTINWWEVREGATIMSGFPTIRSQFIIGWSTDCWFDIPDEISPYKANSKRDMEKTNYVLVQVLFRL